LKFQPEKNQAKRIEKKGIKLENFTLSFELK